MAGRRFDSLFARLMLAQTLLMLLVGLMFVAWLMAARTQATAMPFAQLWAGPLAAAARQPVGAALPEASPGYPVFRQSSLPAGFKSYNLTIGLGFRLWQTEFAARGLAFDDLRFVSTDGPVQLWFHVVRPGDSPVWLQAPRIWPFENFNNVPAALLIPLLMACLFVGLSGWFARRVTRPLQDLRQRMHGDVLAIDAMSPPGAAAASGMARASSEIRAIDHDYQQLLERLRSAELERALLLAGVSHDLRSAAGAHPAGHRVAAAAQRSAAAPRGHHPQH